MIDVRHDTLSITYLLANIYILIRNWKCIQKKVQEESEMKNEVVAKGSQKIQYFLSLNKEILWEIISKITAVNH